MTRWTAAAWVCALEAWWSLALGDTTSTYWAAACAVVCSVVDALHGGV